MRDALNTKRTGRAQIASLINGVTNRTTEIVVAIAALVSRYSLAAVNGLTFGKFNNCKATDSVSTTASSATVTCADNPWVAGDVGKSIDIAGAGTAGAVHSATIATFVSAGEITITPVAVTTVTASKTSTGGLAAWGDAVNAVVKGSPLTLDNETTLQQTLSGALVLAVVAAQETADEALAAAGGGVTVLTDGTSGSPATFTPDANGDYLVECLGAGGGGGSGTHDYDTAYGGGGGKGQHNKRIVALTTAQTIAYYCGAKGIGGVASESGANGTDGGNTVFDVTEIAGSAVIALGGKKGNVGGVGGDGAAGYGAPSGNGVVGGGATSTTLGLDADCYGNGGNGGQNGSDGGDGMGGCIIITKLAS